MRISKDFGWSHADWEGCTKGSVKVLAARFASKVWEYHIDWIPKTFICVRHPAIFWLPARLNNGFISFFHAIHSSLRSVTICGDALSLTSSFYQTILKEIFPFSFLDSAPLISASLIPREHKEETYLSRRFKELKIQNLFGIEKIRDF